MVRWGKAGVRLAREDHTVGVAKALGRQKRDANMIKAKRLWGEGNMPSPPPKPYIVEFQRRAFSAARTLDQGELW